MVIHPLIFTIKYGLDLCFASVMTELNYFRDETESGDCETRDSFSDSCSFESESDKLWRWDGCSSEEGGFEQENNLWHLNDRLGHLYFEYFERSTPYGRVPLMDKVPTYPFHQYSFLLLQTL